MMQVFIFLAFCILSVFLLVKIIGRLLLQKKGKVSVPMLCVAMFFTTYATFVIAPESYFTPYPMIDTITAPGFSVEKFNDVKKGMSRDSVITSIGTPLSSFENSGENQYYCDQYTNDGRVSPWLDFAWLSTDICYDKKTENVISTDMSWHYD